MNTTKRFLASRNTSVLRKLLLFGCFVFLFSADAFSQLDPKCDSFDRIDVIFHTDYFFDGSLGVDA